jgi:GNAT superfamily N-acetyltransferase
VTITVRPATATDLPVLLALYAELHPDDAALPAGLAAAVWGQIEQQAGRTILVAVTGERVCGTVDCSVLANLTRGARPFMLLENVVVAATSRRGGVGRHLLAAAAELALAARCYKIQLMSRADRPEAHAFYESCGYRPAAQGYRRYLA